MRFFVLIKIYFDWLLIITWEKFNDGCWKILLVSIEGVLIVGPIWGLFKNDDGWEIIVVTLDDESSLFIKLEFEHGKKVVVIIGSFIGGNKLALFIGIFEAEIGCWAFVRLIGIVCWGSKDKFVFDSWLFEVKIAQSWTWKLVGFGQVQTRDLHNEDFNCDACCCCCCCCKSINCVVIEGNDFVDNFGLKKWKKNYYKNKDIEKQDLMTKKRDFSYLSRLKRFYP